MIEFSKLHNIIGLVAVILITGFVVNQLRNRSSLASTVARSAYGN